MEVLAEKKVAPTINAEWQRMEVLVRCLMGTKLGKDHDAEQLDLLEQLQNQVEWLRMSSANPWLLLPIHGLPPLAMDVLAAVYISEAQPRIGWLYQELQSGSPQPYITPALLQILLALNESEVCVLQGLIGPDGELIKRNLIVCDGDTPFSVLRPVRAAMAALMGWPQQEAIPPGAIRVNQKVDWHDLILPTNCKQMLREYLLWLHHRDTVINKWGGRQLGGPLALFSGPSGTGKTYAASVIATELGWPLYRVDLSRLVSKYIGETEKNLARLFDAAHGKPMVLQFDEADALMSKRGEIKEARDRYANMEVSYLLARIEDHQGPCILTTNLRSQIDKAFSRRFQMVVEFPRPSEEARIELWRRMLPRRAPLSKCVDFDLLGKSINITGGNIRNAALHAAYLAAEDNQAINMTHIAIAVWREMAKERPQLNKRDLGLLGANLPESLCQ
ncbi:MAG: ATP-binding protein [Nitrosomonas sp.]|nr:ATP-binding protein [Nitrosomonas sp.]